MKCLSVIFIAILMSVNGAWALDFDGSLEDQEYSFDLCTTKAASEFDCQLLVERGHLFESKENASSLVEQNQEEDLALSGAAGAYKLCRQAGNGPAPCRYWAERGLILL